MMCTQHFTLQIYITLCISGYIIKSFSIKIWKYAFYVLKEIHLVSAIFSIFNCPAFVILNIEIDTFVRDIILYNHNHMNMR